MVHITAHSGCDGTPDNSLEFVRHALQTNADALEVDVRKTKDGILAISHDAILDGQDAPALRCLHWSHRLTSGLTAI